MISSLFACLALTLQAAPQVLSPLDVDTDSLFGAAADIDGTTAVISATQDAAAGYRAGSIHFYDLVGSEWIRTQTVLGTPLDRLGSSVAISGDFAAVSHGTPFKVVEVFERQLGVWARVDVLDYPGDPVSSPRFGVSLTLDGTTLVVGAPLASEGGVLAGAAYVYERSGAGWQLSATIPGTPNATTFPTNPNHGSGVALDGDTLVVSSPRRSAGGVYSAGVLYVYERQGGGWNETAAIEQPAGLVGTVLGAHGLDLDGDRIAAAAVGFDLPATNGSGIVHVFDSVAGAWGHAAAILDPRPSSYASFGFSLGLLGDRLVIGRSEYHVRLWGEVDATLESFQRGSGGDWQLVETLFDPNPGPLRGFGYVIAFGPSGLMIPAFSGTSGGKKRGKVYVVDRPTSWGVVSDTVCSGTVCACPTSDDWSGCGNSTQREGRLYTAGSASIGADDLEVYADHLPAHQMAILRLAPMLGAPQLFGEGALCVNSGTALALQSTSVTGTVDVGPGIVAAAASAGAVILPGDTWFLQLIYDDPQRVFRCRTFPARPLSFPNTPWNGRPLLTAGGFNVTNALAVTWTP